MADKISYPRIPESNWWSIRTQFRKTVPTIVTISYLKSLLNLTTDKAASNLIPPLKLIKLIDDDNKPTSRAYDWRDDSKYKETCQIIIKELYPTELLELFPGPDYDRNSIISWFMHTAQLGQGAAHLAASFYILLSQGQLKSDIDNLLATKPKKQTPKSNKSVKSNQQKITEPIITELVDNQLEKPKTDLLASDYSKKPQPSLHIDLQVHISPEASAQQIDNIFASIAKHLYDK